MKNTTWIGLAICTILTLAPNAAGAGEENSGNTYERYRNDLLIKGSQTFPLLAQLTHRQALEALQKGDLDRSEQLLLKCLEFDPNYSDAYFTLSKIKARQFSNDTFYYVSRALSTFITNFRYQRLAVINGILFLIFALVFLVSIFCFAFTIKYLPYAAHRLKELIVGRFDTAWPGLSAYLLLLIPFALLPGIITGIAILILISWGFMLKREKLLTILFVLPFIFLGFFSSQLNHFAPLADPSSLTSRIATANESHSDPFLIATIEKTPAGSLDLEKNLSLGLLHLRSEQFMPAATHFLRAISIDPENSMAYVNLGNVYYLQGEYNKALEGYRKAAALDSLDAICQYNLAQGYIKTLLLAESSTALWRASDLGIEKVKQSYAAGVLNNYPVYPKTFSAGDLWRISWKEGKTYERSNIGNILIPLMRFTPKASAWILLGTILFAMIFYRFINSRLLTFQCSNCGELTCEDCCSEKRGGYYCRGCTKAIENVSSEKVVEALLRQRRQVVIVKRRRSVRLITSIIPGVRDLYYGRILKGVAVAALFSVLLIFLWSKGLLIKDWTIIFTGFSLWKTVLAVAGIVVSYALSIFSKPTYSFRSSSTRMRSKEYKESEEITNQVVA